MHGGSQRFYALVSLLLACLAQSAIGQSLIQYVYDDVGRLIAVVDPSGDTATYTYDAVGNLLSIDRHASSQVSIISFSPASGPTGTVVTIFGTGFSATQSLDSVTFGGVAAAVSMASPTQLVATVPAGAATGAIAVTAPSGSATSAQSFSVNNGASAPTITSFTPTSGASGTAFGIDGTNFDAVVGNDRVAMNATSLVPASATASHLTASVPTANMTSGRLQVSTIYGTATSTSDFYVAPTGYTAANIEYAARFAGFGSANALTATITTGGNVGLLLFDAAAGHRVSLSIESVTIPLVRISLLSPYGATLSTVIG
ncbi:MAG: IPT/TIG domain-containing protein, partial [bacterium]